MKAKFLEAIIREMQIGVVVIDSDRRLLYANPFFEKTFSASGKAEGRELAGAIKDSALTDAIDEILMHGTPQKEIEIHSSSGLFFEVRLVPFMMDAASKPESGAALPRNIQKGGKSRVVIGFFHDVTEEKRVEAIKRDFVANVSHELRTPLASIKGYAETLLDGALDDRATLKNFLSIIDRHANRMTALIEDLLTLSMLESHQIPMSFERVDMRGLIASVFQGFEKQAKDKAIEFSMEAGSASEALPGVTGDKNRLEQVIVNLVDNAIKYTTGGRIKVSARQAGDMLQVDVEDTGIGIPEKDISRIFERFYRVDKGRSREMGGTGLGLAIVKHIIQGHNGRIWVKSRPGKGTTFSFAIPIARYY